jgi:tetratricopeptide (TPR) repeat protein
LRRSGASADSDALLRDTRRADPLDATLRELSGAPVHDAGVLVDVAIELRDAGEVGAAQTVLERAIAAPHGAGGNMRPIACYLAAGMLDDVGRADDAARYRSRACVVDQTWAFPSGLDALDALQAAVRADADDPVAHALLGMLLYANGRRRDAMGHWDRAVALGSQDPELLRNAALAAYNVAADDDRAWDLYQRAVARAPSDARLRYEQDQLSIRLGHGTGERFERLRAVEELVLTRDDLSIEYVRLLVAEGDALRAHRILIERPFHPWEGGEGLAVAAWDATLESLGLPPADPPANLGEARAQYVPPVARHGDGRTDYFATSLPELFLFSRDDDHV